MTLVKREHNFEEQGCQLPSPIQQLLLSVDRRLVRTRVEIVDPPQQLVDDVRAHLTHQMT